MEIIVRKVGLFRTSLDSLSRLKLELARKLELLVMSSLVIKVYTCPPNPVVKEINFRRLQITTNHIGLQITSNQPDFCEKWDKKGYIVSKIG